MGCCVSKCKPRRQLMEEMSNLVHVQDKLVISQTPKTPLSVSNRVSPLPPPLSSTSNSSSSFASYFSNSSATTTTTCSSSKPVPSSPALTSKDRSFSNEFLLSCVKENPHIIRMNTIKEAPVKLAMNKPQASQVVLQPQRPPKRVRSSSPTAAILARQKSFRREEETANSAAVLACRTLRSPSPSRRFTSNTEDKRFRGILASVEWESHESKRVVGTKVNALNSVHAALGREKSRRVSQMGESCLRKKETRNVHRVSSKIDQVAVGAALSHQISESLLPPEDFDNPLISLDCFIFL